MASTHRKTRSTANRIKLAAQISCAIVAGALFVCGAGYGIASAFGTSGLAFGIGEETSKVTTEVALLAGTESQATQNAELTTGAKFDVTASIDTIEAKIIAEREAAEAAKRAKNEAKLIEVNARIELQRSTVGIPSMPEVDWSVGEEAFIEEWTKRIDAYLAGYPLAGMGVVFAQAAWDNAVDPRWSPAIAMIESTKGKNCFRYHNAWGWGSSSWSTWEEAIQDHVAGLAQRYGYTVSRSYAKLYCPPNEYNWYYNVLEELRSI